MTTGASALKVARFLIVGGTVALVSIALNWAFSRVMSEQAAFLLAYPPALTVHFLLNKWWTFGDRTGVRGRQVGEYLAMAVVTFLIQWAVFTAVVRWTEIPHLPAVAIAIVVQLVVTYLVLSRRVFAPAAREN